MFCFYSCNLNIQEYTVLLIPAFLLLYFFSGTYCINIHNIYNPNFGTDGTFFFFFSKMKTKRLLNHMSQCNILFTIEHREHQF